MNYRRESIAVNLLKIGDKILVGPPPHRIASIIDFQISAIGVHFTQQVDGHAAQFKFMTQNCRVLRLIPDPVTPPKHSHYFKPCPYDQVDVYRVLQLFTVTDPCIQHAVKKLLCAGARGPKDAAKDIREAIDALERWKAMRVEEAAK